MSLAPLFSVIVPTYNRPALLRNCLEALAALDYPAERNVGPGAARNTGAEQARGEYLAFTDDDCRPAPDWLRSLAAAHAERPSHLLGGQTLNGLPENPYSTASQSLQSWLYDYCESRVSPLRFFASNNLGLPREAFLALGDSIRRPCATRPRTANCAADGWLMATN